MGNTDIFILLLMALPLIGGLGMMATGNRMSRKFTLPLSIVMFFLAVMILVGTYGQSYHLTFSWLPFLTFAVWIDRTSAILLVLVAFISGLVQVYSLSYMQHDANQSRYFALLQFFTFSMFGVLIADHLMFLFIFWELVGFSSYLLIGFWYQKVENAAASRKAFITNRIADLGLISAILLLWASGNTLNLSELVRPDQFDGLLVLAGFGLLIGALGKSAQFPFFTWLPDAMVGPTAVSALIHAATMVAAGVYLLARVSILLPPVVLNSAVIIGLGSALMAALAATRQMYIKRVLAYSTISQLGYMIMAVGLQSTGAALFHLWTHAFFKAGLFLAAGSVIHCLHQTDRNINAQDMQVMGGLRKYLPVTFWTFSLCMAALIGLPFFSGFLSKDAILMGAINWAEINGEPWMKLVPILAFAVVFLTAYYMVRQFVLVFLGEARSKLDLIKFKEPVSMIIPMVLLAVGSLALWYQFNPLAHDIAFVTTFFNRNLPSNSSQFVYGLVAISLASAGVLIAFQRFRNIPTDYFSEPSTIQKIVSKAFYFDHFYMHFLVPGFQKLSNFVSWIDTRIIDKSIDRLGMSFVLIGKLADLFDKLIVDGLVKLVYGLVFKIGGLMKLFQSYRLQMQFVWAGIGLLLLYWFFIDLI